MRSGSGNLTCAKMSRIFRLRSLAGSDVCWVSISSTCSPHAITGLSAVIGSWKIIDILTPRTARNCSAVYLSTSSPSSSTSPSVARTFEGSRPITVCAIIDLPEPDSPSRHTISPEFTENEMSRTACARSAPPGKATPRPRTSSTVRLIWRSFGAHLALICHSFATMALVELRIQRVAQAVAQHVDGKHGEREEDAGEQNIVRVL